MLAQIVLNRKSEVSGFEFVKRQYLLLGPKQIFQEFQWTENMDPARSLLEIWGVAL